VDLLHSGLQVERHVSVGLSQRDVDARQPLPETASVKLVALAVRPTADAGEVVDGAELVDTPLRHAHDVLSVPVKVHLDEVAVA
jgi:hypothetical protein